MKKLVLVFLLSFLSVPAWCQSASTGAVSGFVTDPSGALVPGAVVSIKNVNTGEEHHTTTASDGAYTLSQLPSGTYRLQITAPGFSSAVRTNISVEITQTREVSVALKAGDAGQVVSVTTSGGSQLQADDTALGRLVDGQEIAALPLIKRNFTAVLALSPGITQNVDNATELGRGAGGTAASQIYASGSRPYDNNFLLEGVDGSDAVSSTTGFSAGTPIPNPDAIGEFKVQTSQYDAQYGRGAGAHVDLIMKAGTNQFHGSVFEFLRNEDLNANLFFNKAVGLARPILRQNQFGGTIGGPILKNKLFAFFSYQGTRQTQNYSGGTTTFGVTCSVTPTIPLALTNDRSRAALGTAFGGNHGYYANATTPQAGDIVARDGSNISTAAFNLLNLKDANGNYVLPSAASVSSNGNSYFYSACSFNEDQFPVTVDYEQNARSKFNVRFFQSNSTQHVPFPVATVPGSPKDTINHFYFASVAHQFLVTPKLVHTIQAGYVRMQFFGKTSTNFSWAGIGAAAPATFTTPQLSISNVCGTACGPAAAFTIGRSVPTDSVVENYELIDSWSWMHGKHYVRFGGDLERVRSEFEGYVLQSGVGFYSFSDFLLGTDGVTNGTGASNVASSSGTYGNLDRQPRNWDAAMYVQDDYKVLPRLTLNLGMRYEYFGSLTDAKGAIANYWPTLAPSVSTTGSLNGFVVPNNFPGSTLPAGVIRSSNNSATNESDHNAFGPRIGIALRVPNTERVLFRAGYGIFYSHTLNSQIPTNNFEGYQPFSYTQAGSATGTPTASFSAPFVQPYLSPTDFPKWRPFVSGNTANSQYSIDPYFRPSLNQTFTANVQYEITSNLMLEVGYTGKRGEYLPITEKINQAALASPTNPINGVTTNTAVASNIILRAPNTAFLPSGLNQIRTAGSSWYNALEAGLTKRMSRNFQVLTSYTYSKSLDDSFASTAYSGYTGSPLGDQNNFRRRWGVSGYNRPQRLSVSYLYNAPSPFQHNFVGKTLVNGWAISGVTVAQTGQSLTTTGTNTYNAYGITNDLAEIVPGCTNSMLASSGSTRTRIKGWFNKSCFGAGGANSYPLVANPGTGTFAGRDFGNGPVGAIRGPNQFNFDAALTKNFGLGSVGDHQPKLEFRTEAFNLFNHTQFSNPASLDFTSSTFGQITTTSVNSRMLQGALKITF